MAKTQDMTAVLKDMMGAFPVDTAAFEDAFKKHRRAERKTGWRCAERSREIL